MVHSPKFSVIIPCYKAERTLPRTLSSVLASSLKDLEVICINDASPDATLLVLRAFCLKDPRVRIINLESNQGVAAARNAGLDSASGEIIGFVDSDDTIEDTLLADIYAKMQETGSDINIISFKVLSAKGVRYNRELSAFIDSYGSDVQKMNTVDKLTFMVDYCWHCSIRRSFWEKNKTYFPIHIKNSEDQCFWKPLQLKAGKVSLLNTYGYNYLWNPCGASKNDMALLETTRGYDEMMARLPLKFHLRLMEKCFRWMNIAKMKDERIQNRLKREYVDRLYEKAKESGIDNYEFPSYSYTFFHGLGTVKKTPTKKVYKLFGMTMCKIKYHSNFQKKYILGIPVTTIKNNDIPQR